jgi:hypothetical protein
MFSNYWQDERNVENTVLWGVTSYIVYNIIDVYEECIGLSFSLWPWRWRQYIFPNIYHATPLRELRISRN